MKKVANIVLIWMLVFILAGCDLIGGETGTNNAPVVEGESSVVFSINAEEPDWTTMITATDEEDGAIRILEEMVVGDVDFSTAGFYEVRYYVPDSEGKSTLFTLLVEVVDDRVYTFSLLGATEIDIEVYTDFVDPGVLALDLDGVETTYNVTGTVDTTTIGTYSLSYSMDGVEAPLIRTVNVVDTTAPVIEVDTVGLLVGEHTEQNWLEYVDSVTDNYSDDITLLVLESNVVFDVLGTYEVTIKAIDEFGNEATATFVVEISDIVLLVTGDSVIQHEVNTEYEDLGATAIDSNENPVGVSSTTDLDITELGTYTVTYTVEGYPGLTVSRTIEVVDTTAPELDISNQSITSADTDIDWATRITSATDNYDTELTITEIEDNIEYGGSGEFTVTVLIADSSNNQTTVTFTVSIIDEGRIDILLWSGSGTYYEDIGHLTLTTNDLLTQQEASVYAAAKAFNEMYPNIQINVLALPGGPNDGGRIWAQELANFKAEFGFHPSLWTTSDLAGDVERGLVADLSRFENDSLYQQLNPALMNLMNYQGFQAGLPYYAIPWGVYVNKELAENQNIDVPSPDWTIDEYTDFIRNSEEDVYYGSMDSPIRLIETGTNTINKQLSEYDGTGDFVNLNSDEVRSLIPYLNLWNEHSVWGGPQNPEFMDAHWWWSYKFFLESKLLTLEGDPWMLGDCSNPDSDWWGSCKSNDWDYYPRPSTDYVDNTVGIVLDPMAVYNYCLEDGNLACTSAEETQIDIAYMFASFWLADTASWEARNNQEYNQMEANTVGTALGVSFPITTGDLFDEQMNIWYSTEQRQRFSDPALMPGFHSVIQIFKEGQFWDVSDKAYPYFHNVEGYRRDNLYEWHNHWNPDINGGAAKGDSDFVDMILSNLPEWNDLSNERFNESYNRVITAIETYYTGSGSVDPGDLTELFLLGVLEEVVIEFGDDYNALSGVTAMGNDDQDYSHLISVQSDTCSIGYDGTVDTSEEITCVLEYTVVAGGLLTRQYMTLIIGPAPIVVNPQIVREWTFDDESDVSGWNIYAAGGGSVIISREDGAMKLETTSGGQRYETRIDYQGIPLEEGETYKLSFRMKSDIDGKKIHINYGELLPFAPYFTPFKPENVDYITLTTEWQTFEIIFLMEQLNENGGPVFEMGDIDGSVGLDATMWIDDIVIAGGSGSNTPPVINGVHNLQLSIGDEFDPLLGITAIDVEDGDLTSDIIVYGDTVDTATLGEYTVYYSVTDSNGYEVILQITVSVVEPSVTVLPILPTDPIELVFWHVYGQSKGALLDEFIAEFEAMYPNVTIESVSQGNYTDLYNHSITSITAGQTPDILVGYPEHFMTYQNAGALIPLDDFANHLTWGIDFTDFIPSYIMENRQYQGGQLYSFPYSKSTDILMYNKDKFAAMGITVPTDGSITWAMLEEWAETMVGSGENQCEYLINYDSPANFFINSVRQWQGGYTNSNGDILINSDNTIAFMDYITQRFQDKTFALPIAWNEVYGSANFIAGNSCMTVGSTAGINYNIPSYGSFEVGVLPIPQYDIYNPSATQQGPNIGIMSNTTDAERLAAWLFIEFLTNTENSAEWAMLTGYLPVRESSYDTVIYQDFLGVDVTDSRYYQAQAALAAKGMLGYFNYDPAFVGPITSTDVRNAVDMATEALFNGYTVTEVLDDLFNTLNVDPTQVVNPDDGGPALLLPITGIVEEDVDLPFTVSGAAITWTSSDETIVSNTGNVFRPSYGDGNATVTLTAHFLYEDVEYTREFILVVAEKAFVPTYTVVTDLHGNTIGTPVAFEGTVVALFDGGYFLSDGEHSVCVYNPSSTLDIVVGNTVFVSGEYAKYVTLYQISAVTDEYIVETGDGTQILPSTSITIEELLALDSSDPLIHGQIYTITGLVIQQGSYNNLYLQDGEFEVLIYYYSLQTSLDALELELGNVVTIDVMYYTDHTSNGVMVVFQGNAEEIIVN